MKPIFIGLSLSIVAVLLIYWSTFIKPVHLVDLNRIMLCMESNKRSVNLQLAESAKYIIGSKVTYEQDTILIEIKTTTIYNVFNKNKEVGFSFDIKDGKFVKIGDKLIDIHSLRTCTK
jgi:hypothetical protein